MKTIVFPFLVAIALLTGCATGDKSASGPNEPGRVPLLFSKPTEPYAEAGMVSTLKVQPTPGDTWQGALQRQAAGLGADAVIVDTSTLNNRNTPMVNGTAIRYKK